MLTGWLPTLLLQEQRGEYAQAEALYEDVLQENSANALVSKRRIAVLKAQKKTPELILALNEFLRSYQTDQATVRAALSASAAATCD